MSDQSDRFFSCWTYTESSAIAVNVRSKWYGGGIGYKSDGTTSAANTTRDFDFGSAGHKFHIIGTKLPAAGLTLTRNTSATSGSKLFSQDHGQSLGAARIYAAHCDIIRNTTEVRSGGAGESLECVSLSNLGTGGTFTEIISWTEDAVPASSQTRTVYIEGTGWSANYPTAAQLYLEATYISNATTFTRATAVSTEVLSSNSAWVAFNVTFVPAAVAAVTYRVVYAKYVNATTVYMDFAAYNGSTMMKFTWVDGEPTLIYDTDNVPATGGGAVARPRIALIGGF
jgi:hypothetical protein